jgi:hypothetical protein
VELPVSGWLVFNPAHNFYEFSASMGGRRIDYVKAREYEFLDGRGQWTEQGNLAATGSVALRERGDGVLEFIDIYGNNRIAFQSKAKGVLMAYDPEGKTLGRVELSTPREGWHQFKTVSGARSYVFAPTQ